MLTLGQKFFLQQAGITFTVTFPEPSHDIFNTQEVCVCSCNFQVFHPALSLL